MASKQFECIFWNWFYFLEYIYMIEIIFWALLIKEQEKTIIRRNKFMWMKQNTKPGFTVRIISVGFILFEARAVSLLELL